MWSVLVCVLLLTTATGATSFNQAWSESQCDLQGLCDGTFLGVTLAENKAECVLYCRETTGCFWYSLDMGTMICVALEDCPKLDESKTNTTSGNKECSGFTCNKSGMCEGVLVSADPASTADTCLRMCQVNPVCLWFTFVPEDGVCIQLEDCPEITPCEDCISGQKECKGEGSGSMNKVMIGSKTFEQVDLANSSAPICKLPDYPFPIRGPAAMVYDKTEGVVRACGGYIPSKANTNKCFIFDGFQWKDMLPTNASYDNGYDATISANVPAVGWWMLSCSESGGAGCFRASELNSEIFLNNNTWTTGPKLPEYNTNSSYTFPGSYCTVQLNSTHTMITGGIVDFDESSIPDVWFYDWTRQEWLEGPSMIMARRSHDCLQLGEGRVMVAGGTGLFSQDLISVEVYDQSMGGWYMSEDLPEDDEIGQYTSQLINWNGSPLWINLQKFWIFEDGEWTFLGEKAIDWDWDFAINVPDDFIPDC